MKELLLYWMRKQKIDDNLRFKEFAIEQECFVRDTICTNLLRTHAFVVSTHISKSVELPVYAFMMTNGIKVICRNNFYGWKISVELPKKRPVSNILPEDIFEDGYNKDISSCYFEGFKSKWIYPGYFNNKNQKRFSFAVYNDYEFYLVMYTLKHLYGKLDLTKEINKLKKDDVVKSIDSIYQKNGFFEINQVFQNGHVSREMCGWEIMWMTYHHLEDPDFRKKYDLSYPMLELCDHVDAFADEILKYPEITNTFALEKKMYEVEF